MIEKYITTFEPGTIAPPTYQGAKHAIGKQWRNGECVDTVLIDAPQSQANRIESLVLQNVSEIGYPTVTVDCDHRGVLNLLELPHRVADAILIDSLIDSRDDEDRRPWRDTDLGKAIIYGNPYHDAQEVFRHAPLSLVLGFWQGQTGAGSHAVKVTRSITSTITGFGVVWQTLGSGRIDPLGIEKGPVLYKPANDRKSANNRWTVDKKEADTDDKGKPILFGKGKDGGGGTAGSPASAGHGNASANDGKCVDKFASCSEIERQLFFKDTTFRSFRYNSGKRCIEAEAVLAALSRYAIALLQSGDDALRASCDLIPVRHSPRIDVAEAKDNLEAAKKTCPIKWSTDSVHLNAGPTLKLISV